MTSEKIELVDIAKTYYLEARGKLTSRVALACVNVEFIKGEIHSVIGENGAGKSTLVHILSGRIKPSSGGIKIDGKTCVFSSPYEAIKKGVAIIFQSLPQVFEATVLENIMLVQKCIVYKKDLCSKIRSLLQEWGIGDINFNARINTLSKEECFFIELVNCLSCKPNVLILDESSSFIPSHKRDGFFCRLKEYAKDKKIAVITITHDIEEAIKISDKITIIKGGKNLKTINISKFKKEQSLSEIKIDLEKAMYGRVLENEKTSVSEKNKKQGIEIYFPIVGTIEAKEGEITGFLNSNRLFEDLISGVLPPSLKKNYKGGIKLICGTFLPFTTITPNLLLKNKIGFIPSDRYYRASNPKLTIKEALSCYHIKKQIINEKERESFVLSILREENIETSILAPCNHLSGGQLQRIMLARCLKEEPKVIILVEPMRGLDVASIEIMKKKLRMLKDDGKTILIITQEENTYSDIFDRVIKNRIV